MPFHLECFTSCGFVDYFNCLLSNTSFWHQNFAQYHVSRQNTEIITEHTNVNLCQQQISQQVLTEFPCVLVLFPEEHVRGPVSISDKTSYHKISWNLEAARFVLRIVRSLWNLTGTSAAVLPRRLSNCKAIRCSIYQSRGFETSRDLRIMWLKESCIMWRAGLYDIFYAIPFQEIRVVLFCASYISI